MKRFRYAVIVVALAVYTVVFYATPLTDVRDDTGQLLSRGQLTWQLFWLPDELLLPNWFGSPPEFSLLDRLPVLGVAGLIVGWAAAVGWLALVLCRLHRQLDRLELAVFSTAVGLNVLSTWVLAAGLLGMLDRLTVFIVLMLLTVGVTIWTLKTKSQGVQAPQEKTSGWFSPWLLAAVPFLLVILLAAVLPPLDFDVREYHLQAPKEFFQQGRITFLPHNVYANMALGTEMLSLLAMVVAGDWWLGGLAGKTVIACFTPLVALALLAAGRRLFTPIVGAIAAVVYVSVPWIVSISSAGLVEGGSACYLFLAVYALLLRRMLPESGKSMTALAGYMAGAAVATKYPAALFVLLPLAVWIVMERLGARDQGSGTGNLKIPKSQNPEIPNHELLTSFLVVGGVNRCRSTAAALGIYLLAAALGCGLWFGKNWALTGNPTYPLLYGVFGGKTWTAEKQRQWTNAHRPDDFSPESFFRDIGRVALTSPWNSPLLVPLAALAIMIPDRRRREKQKCFFGNNYRGAIEVRWLLLAYIGFVIAAWWLLTHRIDRFWLPVLPVMALLAGLGAQWSTDRWWRVLLTVLLLVGLGANFLMCSIGRGNAWFVSLQRLRTEPGWIDPWHAYFNTQPGNGRLLCVGDAAVFDLVPPVLYNTCFDDCILEQIAAGQTPQQIREELASRNIEFVYVDWSEIARYRRTYGYSDFVQPELFDRLVAAGVLEPLPAIEGHAGQAFRRVGP